MRDGTETQERLLRIHASPAWLGLRFPAALSLALRPGQSVSVRVEGRCHSGSNELRLAWAEADRCSEAVLRRAETGSTLALPRDGAWHRAETVVTVPPAVHPDTVIRPMLVVPEMAHAGPAGIEIRDLVIGQGSGRGTREAAPGIRDIHDRPDLRWASSIYSCHFTFLYDSAIRPADSAGWRVEDFLDDGERVFGGYDAVVLWQAYPRIGIDPRNQFDHYRDMPGGLAGLRDMIRAFHARGVRVFIDYNPWDQGTRREGIGDEEALAALVREIDADGIFLDTMNAAPSSLRSALDRARPGVVLAPEGHLGVDQLALCNASWGQWLRDPQPPGALRLKWIEPRHMQHQVRRWDTDHRGEIETAFFNGSGMLVWENVFGAYNPWSADDCAMWKRAVGILRAFADVFTGDGWDPFIPTRSRSIFAHRWLGDGCALYTVRNSGPALRGQALFDVVDMPPGAAVFDLWNGAPAALDGATGVIGGVDGIGCWFVGREDDSRVKGLLAKGVREAVPAVQRTAAASVVQARLVERTPPVPSDAVPAGMVLVPGGTAGMLIRDTRRECGCYPDPGTARGQEKRFLWGSPFEETLTHDYRVELQPYFIDEAQVSNGQFKRFLSVTGWRPRVTDGFLAHWPGGRMPESIADLPVVHVDLDDARAYARWVSRRLPTEPEWHLAAQGRDGRAWPWGAAFDASRCAPGGTGPMPVRSLPEGRSPFGCYHMSGNVWEWTESERDDGHTRFAIVRGGSWFRPAREPVVRAGGTPALHEPREAPAAESEPRPRRHDRLPLRSRRLRRVAAFTLACAY